MTLESIYQALLNAEVITKQSDVGPFINRAPSYYSSTIARDRNISYETLHRFYWSTHDVYIATIGALAEEQDPKQKEAYEAGVEELETLLGMLQSEMDRRMGR